ncbi:MAG: hypothetical protein KDG54_17595, partial [Geminicoccaceae bacterium]|nr:hypothetical protein [Geminicoccaceae bacterium]
SRQIMLICLDKLMQKQETSTRPGLTAGHPAAIRQFRGLSGVFHRKRCGRHASVSRYARHAILHELHGLAAA